MPKYCFFVQSIDNVKAQRIIAYELLLREWNEAEQRWQLPDDFNLPAGQLIQLLKSAVDKLGNHRISVNLTNQQFEDTSVMEALTHFVDMYMVPRQLTVELVEKPKLSVLKEMSANYRKAGIILALDDVGSDNLYDEVKELLPYLNTVKFAIQNIRQFGEATSNQVVDMLQFWFQKAEEQQMLFTFEGIEDESDIALSVYLGVTRGQGYYFTKPQPIETIMSEQRDIQPKIRG